MKFKLHFSCLLLLIFSTTFSNAQSNETFNCGYISENSIVNFTPLSTPTFSGSVDPVYLASFPSISFDIYFWIINKTDGSAWLYIDEKTIRQNIEKMNEHFKPMGICFILKGYSIINNDEMHNGAQWSDISNYATINNYVIPNCFNVYLPRSAYLGISGVGGVTNPGNNKLAVTQGNFTASWGAIFGNVITHEMAHTFGLDHTFGGNNNGSTTEEHVTRNPNDINYNALTTADKVHDTPAMISFSAEATLEGVELDSIIDFNTCEYLGNHTDSQGTSFILTSEDVRNFMAYTHDACRNQFTPGQGIKIREYINGSPNQLSVKAMRNENISLDLFIKDSPEDFGEEPNTVTEQVWNSKDIWVRNLPDNGMEHQNPEYSPTSPNYVYVKVTNRGCDTSTGNEIVKLYWSKASTSLAWDYHWTGNNFPNNGPSLGDMIGTLTIPVLQPDEEAILQFTWNNLPNPANYTAINTEPWHFCLLARIEGENDPMTFAETTFLTYNVTQNNNIGWKNLTMVDLDTSSDRKNNGGVIAVGGDLVSETSSYNLTFKTATAETGAKIFDEAEVSINLDEVLRAAWERGGKKLTNIVQKDRNTLIVKGEDAILENLIFNQGEIGTLNLKFNFLTEEITDKNFYTYHVIQTDRTSSTLIGGETYEINKSIRNLFYADGGGNKQVNKNETIVLRASQIDEEAIYNWYDSEENIIYEGADFTISTDIAKKYKLEIIALSDGYKDYTEVEVNLKPNSIESVSPNPATNQILVNYNINKGNSAYISINSFYGFAISNNYILDLNFSKTTIDITNLPIGIYIISLISNNGLSDNKTLIKI
jgi:hypothetical protein